MEEKFSDAIMEIQAGYLVNNCKGCPFYGIEEYEIKQRCNGVPLNCVWWWLSAHFKQAEQEEEQIESEEA